MDEGLVSDILAIIPDACPGWVRQQIALQLAVDPFPYHAQARILDSAFTYGYVKLAPRHEPAPPPAPAPIPQAAPPAAPKSHVAEKRKATDQNLAPNPHMNKKRAVLPRIDYTKLARPGEQVNDFYYRELSVKYLCASFGRVPLHYIRKRFNETGRLVPVYLIISEELKAGTMRCQLLKKKRVSTGPRGDECNTSSLFASEKSALDSFVASGGANLALLREAPPADESIVVAGPSVARADHTKQILARAKPAGPVGPSLVHPRGDPGRAPAPPKRPVTPPKRFITPPRPIETSEMECGCCFADTNITEMVQCTEGHLFCVNCAKQNAETAVGARKSDILCMDQSGCRAPFPDDQLRRILSDKTFDLIERLRQKKDLEEAKIGGLEHCPFCDFACIIVGDGRTFECQKATCKTVSCRKCWKKDHAPKTCEEMETEEKNSKGEHEVAEAMTKALIRDCPNCKTPFMKEAGCNKMTCPKCAAISCYICRKELSRLSPYTHFDQQPDAYHLAPAQGRCRLWDIDRAGRTGGSPTRAHAEEVSRAEKEARARLAAAASGKKLPAPQLRHA